jgi:hypothetical protein
MKDNIRLLPRLLALFVAVTIPAVLLNAASGSRRADLWCLKPVVRPQVPTGVTESRNPIDAFLSAKRKEKGLHATGSARKRTLLRRVYLDLIGIPPSPVEQDEFLSDTATDAYEHVVDRLLASEQHGVRYARHWLDVLRYTDIDDQMAAESGVHHWRDWVISSLNEDLPYDKFVRAQLTGYRDDEYTIINENGIRRRNDPRPYDLSHWASWRAARSGAMGKTPRNCPSPPWKRCRRRSWG